MNKPCLCCSSDPVVSCFSWSFLQGTKKRFPAIVPSWVNNNSSSLLLSFYSSQGTNAQKKERKQFNFEMIIWYCFHAINWKLIKDIRCGMFRVSLSKHWFTTPIKNHNNSQINSITQELLEKRKSQRIEIRKKLLSDVPAEMQTKNFYDSLVNITLYMRQDCWKSQYIFHMLNYHQLGFRRVSDLVFLDRASYFLDLRKMRES